MELWIAAYITLGLSTLLWAILELNLAWELELLFVMGFHDYPNKENPILLIYYLIRCLLVLPIFVFVILVAWPAIIVGASLENRNA